METRIVPVIMLITGRIQGGKTTFVSMLVKGLAEEGYSVAGFLSRGHDQGEVRLGYDLENIETGESWPLASVHPIPGWTPFRRFWFNPETFRRGEEWLLGKERERPHLMVIDEVGPLEMEDRGWSPLLAELNRADRPVPQLWVAREHIVPVLKESWNIPDSEVFHMREWEPLPLIRRIIQKIEANEQQK